MIDGVADALAGANGDARTARLREQYRVALVDEFQDTDARQWAIFERAFARGEDAALLLIGDPKQAIYGFRGGDVHAYLEAAQEAQRAPCSRTTSASRPALLAAIDALYANANAAFAAGDADAPPFVDPRIAFHPVEAGGQRTDEDFRREGANAPALTLWQAPATGEFNKKGEPTQWRAGESREHATRACVAAIHRVLPMRAPAGRRSKANPCAPATSPCWCVRTPKPRVRQALALAGIPRSPRASSACSPPPRRANCTPCCWRCCTPATTAACARRSPRCWSAWTRPASMRSTRLSTAMRTATGSNGRCAGANACCAADRWRWSAIVRRRRATPARPARWRTPPQQLPAAGRSAAGSAGTRARPARPGRLARPAHRRRRQGRRNPAAAAGIGRAPRADRHLAQEQGPGIPAGVPAVRGHRPRRKPPGRCCIAYDEHDGRGLHWKLGDPAQWKSASDAWRREQRAEDARLLYVGLTRARQALWIATSGEFYASDKAPLANMLRDAHALRAAGVVFDATPPPEALPRLPSESDAAVPPARGDAPPARRLVGVQLQPVVENRGRRRQQRLHPARGRRQRRTRSAGSPARHRVRCAFRRQPLRRRPARRAGTHGAGAGGLRRVARLARGRPAPPGKTRSHRHRRSLARGRLWRGRARGRRRADHRARRQHPDRRAAGRHAPVRVCRSTSAGRKSNSSSRCGRCRSMRC